jgi:hypothetical protein
LNTAVAQPAVTLSDVLLGDYRYRTGDKFVFVRQPVAYIAGVVGEVTGRLDPQSFYLVHPNNPMGVGRSTKAGDYLQVVQSNDPTVVAPTGTILSVTGETHVLTGFYVENVFVLGADSLSLMVQDPTGHITYRGPYDPSGMPDYEIVEGTQTAPMGIRRTRGSNIPDGGSVVFAYDYDENFVVTYQVNLVTSAVQSELNTEQHASGDALAKDAFMVPVDVTATVVLQRGALQNRVEQSLLANLRYLVSSLRMGVALRRSDVISALDNTDGVSYVSVPLTTMARAVRSQVAYNALPTNGFSDTHRVSPWSTPTVATWLIRQELDSPTVTGGGTLGTFSGVFRDDRMMTMQVTTPESLSLSPLQSYIIGDDGYVIPGYSDNATLIALGYVTETDQARVRLDRTRNRVLVSLPVGESPVNHSYWTTYTVGFSRGDQDITPSTVEFLVLGAVSFMYSEDRATS